MKKNGFTLIELLAVIVVLAVIALIVTPVISRVIDGAKKSAAKQSVSEYVRAIDSVNNLTLLNNPNNTSLANRFEYNVDINGLDVQANGNKPTNGYVNIVDNRVYSGTFCVDNYVIDYNNGKTEIVSEDGCNVLTKYALVDLAAGFEVLNSDEPSTSWERYVKSTYINDVRISMELCSTLNGKTVCVGGNRHQLKEDIVKEDNGLFSTNLCSDLSHERIAELEENGIYKADGFTCTYDNKVYEYTYQERKVSSDEYFIPAKKITQMIRRYSNGKSVSRTGTNAIYYTNKDIRLDILPYLNMSVDELEALSSNEVNMLSEYFQISKSATIILESGKRVSRISSDVNQYGRSMKDGIQTYFVSG